MMIIGMSSGSAQEKDQIIVKKYGDLENSITESVLIEEVENLHNAEVLQPDYTRSIDAVKFSIQSQSWGTERIGASQLKGNTDAIEGTVIVALIDTGIDYNHPYLKDRIVDGYDFVDDDTDTMDTHFHGTHVAGIIVDTTPLSVKIMPIRVFNEEGLSNDVEISKGIRFAIDNGADIINLSFAGDIYSAILENAIDYALSKNVPIIVSAGNESIDTKNSYPASEEKVIVVTATDKNDQIASFSNTGNSIDFSAPGVDIISSIPGGQFASASGTSMATPFVTGIVAMLKLEDPFRSVQDIELLLKKYAEDRGTSGWDPTYGEGIINVKSYYENSINNSTNSPSNTEQRDIPLNKVFTVTMNRLISDKDVLDIKLLRGDKETPITLSSYVNKKEIHVTPNSQLLPRTKYRLIIQVKDGTTYEKYFVTKS